jgi:hypothetical protein
MVRIAVSLTFLNGFMLIATSPAQFREHVITRDLQGGYQVVAVDMDNDGDKDLLVVASGMSELAWYENPGWPRHVIASGLHQMINVAARDVNQDGIPELILASEFSMEPAKSQGIVWLLENKGNPRELWSIREIDHLPTTHRLRWARVGAKLEAVCINAPLAGAAAHPPDYKERVSLVLYRPGLWKREEIPTELKGVLHGIAVTDWDGDGTDELLTASFQGVHLIRPKPDGGWSMQLLAQGNPAAWPKCGSSEVAAGRLGPHRFFCAIEPWHGNQVVVYTNQHGEWRRMVLDDTFSQGHALAVADLNGDGLDEIIAGYRGQGTSVFIYSSADDAGQRWTRSVLDNGGIPASSCDVADLNGDGRLDIICTGDTLLKWYENIGPQR